MFQNNLLMAAASISAGGFSIDYSCRFNDDDSAYLEFTPTTSSAARKTFTVSAWYKRGNIGTVGQTLISPSNSGMTVFSHLLGASYSASDDIKTNAKSGSYVWNVATNVQCRDPNAWYHQVMVVDTTESAASDRLKIYLNGVQITGSNLTTETYPALDLETPMNFADCPIGVGRMGAYTGTDAEFFDGYMAQVAQVSELALEPTSFGEFDDNGVWRPIDITGLDYSGENSFLLDFADSGNFGNDVSGNDNDFSSSGLAATDQMTDTPTNNFCTLSPIDKSSNIPLSDGNLVGTFTSSWYNVKATFGVPSSGKWSFQLKGSSAYLFAGVIFGSDDYTDVDTNGTDALYYYGGAGIIATYRTGSYVQQTGLNTPTADENMEILIDKDNDQIGIVIDDVVEMGTDSGLEIQDTMTKFFIQGLNNTLTTDFGQGGYVPSQTGYLALSTANLTTPTILDGTANFQPTLYTGNGSVRNIDQTENSTFQPDLVWIKNRSAADSNMQIDVARGVTKEMNSDNFAAQTTDANGLTSFDSDGFGLGTGAGGYNDNTENFVAWQWLAGAGAGSSNTDGSINTVSTSVNATAGFSISIWAGTDAEPVTIGHGLGVAPKMIIGKGSGIGNWLVGHDSMGWTKATYWDSTAASYGPTTYYWADTAPTSTVFSTGKEGLNLSGQNWVAYCFAEKEGYSRFESYTGNGNASGPVVYTGFKPAWVMIRKTSGTGNWVIMDSARSPYNEMDDQLLANTTAAETTGSEEIDFLSNGFKIRTADSDVNTSAGTYIYAAFAEYPFGGEDVTPATAF